MPKIKGEGVCHLGIEAFQLANIVETHGKLTLLESLVQLLPRNDKMKRRPFALL